LLNYKRDKKTRKPKRKDTQVPQPSDPSKNVKDEAVHKELGDSLVRVATTVSSLEAEQDSGNITKTRSKATPLMNQVPQELVQIVVPSAKKPWGIQLLRLGLRIYLNFPMIHYSQEVTYFEVMRIDLNLMN
ncbi:hypothetical protein Tco_0362028, partial [Tanacetum coccineum]